MALSRSARSGDFRYGELQSPDIASTVRKVAKTMRLKSVSVSKSFKVVCTI